MSSVQITTRDRILEAAWKLLEAGSGVRLADIAKAAGISRQALYLHFPNRAELLVETVRHIDRVKEVDRRLEASRTAASGPERLDRFVEAWGGYIPEIHGVGKALIAMQDGDAEARKAWDDRMQAVRHGCEAAVEALRRDGLLRADLGRQRATDLLWTLLSVANWEQLVQGCGWSQGDYVATTKTLARRALIAGAD